MVVGVFCRKKRVIVSRKVGEKEDLLLPALETQRVKGCKLVIGSPFLNHHHLFKNRPNTCQRRKDTKETHVEREERKKKSTVGNTAR